MSVIFLLNSIFFKLWYFRQLKVVSIQSQIIIIIIIIIISLMSIFFQDKSRAWTAASQQHYVDILDNQPLATFWDLPFSHSDASISRKSRLVTIRQLFIPGKDGASFWWQDALPHTNQLGLGKRRWNLENLFSGS